jgi:hypothetical protein
VKNTGTDESVVRVCCCLCPYVRTSKYTFKKVPPNIRAFQAREQIQMKRQRTHLHVFFAAGFAIAVIVLGQIYPPAVITPRQQLKEG